MKFFFNNKKKLLIGQFMIIIFCKIAEGVASIFYKIF